MKELISQIDEMIEASRQELISDTVRFVNIKSVEGISEAGAPFGKGVKDVLDTFSGMAEEAGLYCTDYNVGVISAAYKNEEPDVGIWLHGDVVPEGDNWKYDPYNATIYNGCIIGRGATDNKGQLAVIFNIFKIFKKLNINLNYNPAIYLGSNEETGMKDIIGIPNDPTYKGFINVGNPPKLSLVPDDDFPVAYGGKGGINIVLKSKRPLKSVTIEAGSDSSPGLATATLLSKNLPDSIEGCKINKDTKNSISAYSPPRHGSHPDPKGNMITVLSSALLDNSLIDECDKDIIGFLKDVSCDIYGNTFKIATNHKDMGDLTVFSKRVECKNDYVLLYLNVRYPIGITFDDIIKNVSTEAEKRGFELSTFNRGVDPYIHSKDDEIIKMLCNISNEVTGAKEPPYLMSGGTYAHRLPNAYVFGMSGNLPPADFPAGRGGAHGVDEAVSVDRLIRGMKIYARALLAINDKCF